MRLATGSAYSTRCSRGRYNESSGLATRTFELHAKMCQVVIASMPFSCNIDCCRESPRNSKKQMPASSRSAWRQHYWCQRQRLFWLPLASDMKSSHGTNSSKASWASKVPRSKIGSTKEACLLGPVRLSFGGSRPDHNRADEVRCR